MGGQPKQLKSEETKTENLNKTEDRSETSNLLQNAFQNAFGLSSGTGFRGPLEAQAPLFSDLWSRTGNAMATMQANPFSPQNFVPQAGGDANTGVNMLRNLLTGGTIGQGAQDVINMGQATARGDYLDPNKNPFLRATADAAVGRVREGLLESALPQIKDAAIASGAYGGARQDLSEERAVRDFSRSALDASNNLYEQNYQAERGRQMQAPAVLGQGYDLASAAGKGMLSLDEIVRGQEQLRIDDALARFNANNPFRGLMEAAGLLTAGGFGSTGQTGITSNLGTSGGQTLGQSSMHGTTVGQGTSSGTKVMDNPNYEDPFTRMLKMALGGASMVAGAGGKGGFNLWG